MSVEKYDAAIIGAGQGGALARMLAEYGLRVALIEKADLGGTCVNRGCTPTKAHIAAANRAHDARQAAQMGVHCGRVQVDLTAVVQRSQAIAQEFREEIGERLHSIPNLEIIHGHGRFTGPDTLRVEFGDGNHRELRATAIVLAVGASEKLPDVPGLEGTPFLTSDGLLQLTEMPEHLLVMGGGYIACECAQMFRRFGSRVTMLARSGLLKREDDAIRAALNGVFAWEEITVHRGWETLAVDYDPNAPTASRWRITATDGQRQVTGSHLLVATGRTPATRELGLEESGAHLTQSGHVAVDEYLRAGPHVYAMGDAKPGPAFTHVAFDDARRLFRHLTDPSWTPPAFREVPYVVFTDPQLARIGLTPQQARAAGYTIRVASLPVSETARGIESGATSGLLQATIDAQTGHLLGAALLAREAGEMLGTVQLAIHCGLHYSTLRDGVFAHPTLTEALNNLFLAMERQEKGQNGTDCIKTTAT